MSEDKKEEEKTDEYEKQTAPKNSKSEKQTAPKNNKSEKQTAPKNSESEKNRILRKTEGSGEDRLIRETDFPGNGCPVPAIRENTDPLSGNGKIKNSRYDPS